MIARNPNLVDAVYTGLCFSNNIVENNLKIDTFS